VRWQVVAYWAVPQAGILPLLVGVIKSVQVLPLLPELLGSKNIPALANKVMHPRKIVAIVFMKKYNFRLVSTDVYNQK
jgi:hypothetical protein